MSVVEPELRTQFRFPEPDHRRLLIGLRAPQLAILSASILAALGTLMALPSIMGMVGATAAFAIGATLALVNVQGRTVDQWLPVAARWKLQEAFGLNRWRSALPGSGDSTIGAERADPPPPVAGITLVRAARSGGGDLCVVKDAVAGTFSAVVSCQGRSFDHLDPAEQRRMCSYWAQVIASFAHDASPVTRLAWIERTLPDDAGAMKDQLAAKATVANDHPARSAYKELLGSVGGTNLKRQTYVVLCIGGRRARRAIAGAGGGDRGACEVMAREISTLTDRLSQAEIEVGEVLGSRQLAEVLRGAFDPRAVLSMAERTRRQVRLAGTRGRNAWPLATENHWDHYRTDSGFHATYWMAGLPRRDVPTAFMSPLLTRPRGQHTVAVVMEPIPPRVAARAAESAHASHVADEELRARAGYLPSARRRRLHETIMDREAELAVGHAECRFSGYVTVSATRLDDMQESAREMEAAGFDADIELRRLFGEQDKAFTYTLPLGRGLR